MSSTTTQPAAIPLSLDLRVSFLLQDYVHRVLCVTERERFEVPIRAVGPRAILDFPDHLHFPVSPVKCLSQRTLLVRNVGRCEARFQLSTRRWEQVGGIKSYASTIANVGRSVVVFLPPVWEAWFWFLASVGIILLVAVCALASRVVVFVIWRLLV